MCLVSLSETSMNSVDDAASFCKFVAVLIELTDFQLLDVPDVTKM